MVKPFQLSRLPLIYFGVGKINLLPGSIKKFGDSIILVTDQKAFIDSVYADDMIDSISKAGINYHHVVVSGEPSPELIDSVVEKFRNEDIDGVVAAGGGSVLDAGKAISAMISSIGSVKEFLEGVGTKEHPGTKLPFIAMPTTSGTGSEATKNAVISQVGRLGYKKSLRHENFVPDIAIVDPQLTLSCPQNVTAASGMDCFTQLIESYLSDKACEYTDALAWEGLKEIRSSLLQSYLHGDNIQARTGMSFAALTSGICLANAGLGVVHGFASSIGGVYKIPHGIICGTLMASANAITVRDLRKHQGNPGALIKYASLGRLFLGNGMKSDDYYIDSFIAYLQNLTDELQLPKLMQFGIQQKDVSMISEITELKNNPVSLSIESLQEILKDRL